MKRFRLVPLLVLALVLAACSRNLSEEGRLATTSLSPGGVTELEQDLTVNVVFVGFEPGAGPLGIDEAAFLGELPAMSRPQVRYKAFYGLPSDMGLRFDYDYNLVYADTAFEDALFGFMDSIATPMPLTLFQQLYNFQASRALDVTANHWVDGPSVEQWLADNAFSMLGVDTSQYTVFFLNWYGRDDFKFHVITKTDEPDPDTGYDFGIERESRKLIAWGGTTPDDEETGLGSLHRIWFVDLSAGPEAWTDQWNVDDADLDGNGADDVRMPPVWEYGTPGPLPFNGLSTDLGLITRYVAINLLFTSSPLYDPSISGPALPEDIELDINVYQIDPASDGTAYFDVPLINAELNELQPLNSYSTELNSQAFDARVETMYLCFFDDVSCYGQRLFGIAFADPFLYFQDHLMQILEGDGDYEVPIIAWNATDALFTCCLGYADDNWADGTQSFVFAFDSPSVRNVSGYGFTTTTIHEVGHHVAMSHPHDGLDYETGVDYGPGDDYYFAWLGDESNSMMSYIDLNWDFSQFDRDNMNRYMTAVYLNTANGILADILASPKAGRVSAGVASADAHAAAAVASFQTMDYAGAAVHAKLAYEDVVAAAAAIQIKIEPHAWSADYKAKGLSGQFDDSYIDRIGPEHKRFLP